jgi:UDP-N-acetylmuramate dehydrogenase
MTAEVAMLQYSNTPVLQRSNPRVLAMTQEIQESVLAQELKLVAGLKVKRTEPMARYTSMKVGGPADYFIEAATEQALQGLLVLLHRTGTAFYLLGNGSNVLISDRGISGVVVRLAGEFKSAEWREDGDIVRLRVGAAHGMTQLVREAARRGYSGLEFAEGIPGTVGGALVMNAGAYGSEIENVVERVEGLTRQGQAASWSRAEMTFTYRESHLPEGTVVTRVAMRLHKDEPVRVKSKVDELVRKRKNSQPTGFPNSGSMFRNPPSDFAGRLIEAAGLKGKRIGQSQISERHANFVVNHGGAKADDVRALMELARSEVKRQFGIELVPEVRLVGKWAASEN